MARSELPPDAFRWPLAEEDEARALFPDERRATRHVGRGAYQGLEFLHVNARTIINRVPGDRFGFNFTINPYRGCSHACVYCFARPTHEYLGLGVGIDFERKIVVKVNALECLRAELASPRWHGDLIAMGTNTDPYQHAEGKYHLTQGILGILAEARNPFSILTKSTLVLRDLDILVEASARTSVRVNFSVGTLDQEVWRSTEPGTPPPHKRIDAVRRLNEAGVACGVLIAPVLPGLSDREDQIRAVRDAALAAGAPSVRGVPLHLRSGVRSHFMTWLGDQHPSLVPSYGRLFSGGAYQPKQERDRVAKLFQHTPQLAETNRQAPGRTDARGEAIDAVDCPTGAVSVQLRLVP